MNTYRVYISETVYHDVRGDGLLFWDDVVTIFREKDGEQFAVATIPKIGLQAICIVEDE